MKTAAALLADRYPFLTELLTKRLRLVLGVLAAIWLGVSLVAYAHAVATANGFVTIYGPVIGGDFVVFDAAADAAAQGETADIYNADALEAALKEKFPARASFRLSWQYPPTMFLLVLPLALAPFLTSFALWVFATGLLFFAALRGVWNDRFVLFLAIASPAAFQTAITGQTGFLTGALLTAAAFWADRRWLLAGIAAGVLTVKPQLGLLLPVAFIAAGCWRAFAAAAATAIAIALASAAVFGAGAWAAFFDAIVTHGERLQSAAIFPFHKLVSVYGGAMMLGAPQEWAMSLQGAATLALAAIVALTWRRVEDRGLRLAILCSAALLASPYAFYYEIALLIPAMVVVARQGVDRGWLTGERPALVFLWVSPLLLPGAKEVPGLPICFLVVLMAAACVLRRIAHDYPQTFRFWRLVAA